MCSVIKFGLLSLVLFTLPFAQPNGKRDPIKDSLKTLLKVEVERYPLDDKELFTEAPGLKALVDSTYDNLQGEKMYKLTRRIRYPLVLNQNELKIRIAKNKISLAKKKTPARETEGNDSTASEDRMLFFRLFDDEVVVAVCDKIYKTLQGEVWQGHIQGDQVSSARILFDKSGVGRMIKIEMNARPLYIFSNFDDSQAYKLVEKSFSEGGDCVVGNPGDVQ